MNPDERSAWLKSLSVGDRVSIDDDEIATVSAIQRGCFLVGGRKYNKNGQYRDAWHPHEILPVTDELVAAIKERNHRSRLVSILRSARFELLKTDTLEVMCSAIGRR